MSASKNPFIKLLSIGCLVLFGVLLLQVLLINIPFAIADNSPNFAREEVKNKLGMTKLKNLLDTDYSLISSKPLFIEGRKFVEQSAKIDAPQKIKPPINNTFKVRLVGVGLMDKEALVLIVDNKGKYHRLHVNDKLQGWRVKSVGQSNVVFSQLGKDKSFDLDKQRPLLNSNNKAQQ